MKMFMMTLAAGGLLAVASVAQAGEPAQLSDGQLDHVTAGATAIGISQGLALGNFSTFTQSNTVAFADSIAQVAAALATNLSVASSVSGVGLPGGAGAQSASAAAATLP
jgi:hypothetical protein